MAKVGPKDKKGFKDTDRRQKRTISISRKISNQIRSVKIVTFLSFCKITIGLIYFFTHFYSALSSIIQDIVFMILIHRYLNDK